MRLRTCLLAALALFACHKSVSTDPKNYGSAGTQIAFDLDADMTLTQNWNQLPWPSDLRLDASGHPDYTGFPNPVGLAMVESFRGAAMQTHGFSVISTAYFLFSNPIAQHATDTPDALPAGKDQPIFLVDIDANSPERGTFYPVVINTPPGDHYAPDNLLAVAPHPGIVLHARRRYAFGINRSLLDAAGVPLGVAPYLDMLRQGITPHAAYGAQALALYTPAFAALEAAGIDGTKLAGLTIFTTGDEVADDAAMDDALVAQYPITIDQLALDTTQSANNDRACRLTAQLSYPQFQQGTPPFNTQGLFEFADGGLPIVQRQEIAPLVIMLPRAPMPAAGYPVMQYFHGSGGYSYDVADKGPTLTVGGNPTPNQGPGWVHAKSGIASFGSALPVNPERLAGAAAAAYLNLQNPVALRDTFRQGVIEQRMLLRAMLSLHIPAEMIASCATSVNGTTVPLPTLPNGTNSFQFDADHVIAQGQSMGGMYTNLVSAVEPKIKISVPTGAGGFWTYFILQTHLYQGLPPVLAALLETGQPLTQLHPVLAMLQTAWEPNDPYVALPRVARRPLAGHPTRPIYEPVGKGDEYFPTQLYDAIALAYGHQESGDIVWPTMQASLALGGLDGILPYPVTQNRTGEGGHAYTGVVVQYEGDGIDDPHQIYRQLPAVKYQYRCFVESWLTTGIASVPAPAAQDADCP
jgi:hypothetical protein